MKTSDLIHATQLADGRDYIIIRSLPPEPNVFSIPPEVLN